MHVGLIVDARLGLFEFVGCRVLCEISGFSRKVDKNCVLLG